MTEAVDAVVIGAGHHGLVAAAMLADAGWDVVVLEAQPEPGGAVRSAELTPGYITDLFSSYYPMTVASPAIAALHLEDHGLRWSRAPAVVGHPRDAADDDPPILYPDPARTARELARRVPADGENWWRVVRLWDKIKAPLLDAMLAPFPPVRPMIRLLLKLGTAESLRLARLLVQPANTMVDQLFDGEAPRTLLLGNAMHADVPLDAPGSGVMGLLMTMLAQDGGWPVPVGGSGRLTAALVSRACASGARIECGHTVSRVQVRGGRAVGVTTDAGRTIRARRAVVADVTAPRLFCEMLPPNVVPPGLRRDLEHYIWDPPVVKVNYALDGPIPWRSAGLRDVGTVHLGAHGDGLVRWMADLNTRVVPEQPFMLLGQTTVADPSRSPAGTESVWAYTHLPRNVADDASAERLATSMDRVIEEHAPGFGSRVIHRCVQRPSDLEASDANLRLGALNGGTAQLPQMLIFRPASGMGRAETPVERLYLGSASATPGGSVHGACGRNAANAALAADGLTGWPRRRMNRALTSLLIS
ncbi:phytoene desaturase family protein [Mycobacterium conspicuum]|jgi:phytoene dehydrogenase-like protein|uniref:Pyridine nucleotide-disulfide oxidoreductase domain-containing protein 2 n=1 Tax=Mycobacterium conspicuum TaxID=44010 RepID=A0A1X1TCT8_9MYCO|nr:NAD(P)/FAD-dependent oxidoreductase [Mycobacterium conspicuum]ORV42346.1 FAD-dependent oxidoreductase [Mycobacterium conspicuum]BBZ40123.1 dehydrogenase [Mycobacterium conspicuum]